MNFEPRQYQTEAVNALMSFLNKEEKGRHPLIVAPTGSGKTVILCKFIDEYLTKWPEKRVLILSDTQEIISQDNAALESYFGHNSTGVWAASLGRKEIRKITIAQIQSAHRKPMRFIGFDIVVIDECHKINHRNKGMYRKFLNEIDAIYIGLSATHFRLGHGYIHQGEEALFTDIAYDLSEFDKFNKLVSDNYLCKLIAPRPKLDLRNTKGIATQAGDFKLSDLSKKFDRESTTKEAVQEIISYGKNYKKWLIFAIDIAHSEHIAEELNKLDVLTEVVHSKTDDRNATINRFKTGEIRCVVNVNILTTGFDVKDIDLIAVLRHTKSASLHCQMLGRGTRCLYDKNMPIDTPDNRFKAMEAAGKDHCLILDFCGNTERLGPINDIKIFSRGKGNGNGQAVTKECPECRCVCHPSVRICDGCGYKFLFKHKIQETASDTAAMKTVVKEWLDVDSVKYSIHQKKGSPDSLKVSYKCGLMRFSEWVCYGHKGGAKHLADMWVYKRKNKNPMPENVQNLHKISNELKRPNKIFVENKGKYPKILDYFFARQHD